MNDQSNPSRRLYRYFIAPDGENEPTLWRETSRAPIAIARQCETPVEVWARVVIDMDGRSA